MRMRCCSKAINPPVQRVLDLMNECDATPLVEGKRVFTISFEILAPESIWTECKVSMAMLAALQNQRGNAGAISATGGDGHRVATSASGAG
jgi:hypothetical protein